MDRFIDKNASFELSYMNYNLERYDDLLMEKVDRLKERFFSFIQSNVDDSSRATTVAVIESAIIIKSPHQYRQRCRFAISHHQGRLCYALWDKGRNI